MSRLWARGQPTLTPLMGQELPTEPAGKPWLQQRNPSAAFQDVFIDKLRTAITTNEFKGMKSVLRKHWDL